MSSPNKNTVAAIIAMFCFVFCLSALVFCERIDILGEFIHQLNQMQSKCNNIQLHHSETFSIGEL